jgi:Kdo2-lipid IVA lauroyltransferase/acyltransferase
LKKPFRKFRKRIKNWIIYAAVRSGILWMLSVQRSTTMKFLQTVSKFGYYIVPSERKKTIANLTKVFGNTKSSEQIVQMAKQVFSNLGRNMADAFAIPRFKTDNIDHYVKAEGLEIITKALENGTGVIALTGHIGNWELLGAYLSVKGFPINVVGAPIYDPRLDDLVVKNREYSGMKYIARGTATRDIIRALRGNEVVGILTDQDTKRVDGIFVDFLGHPAYTPIGPVILAMKTKAVIVPMAIHTKNDGKHYIKVKEQIPLRFSGDVDKDRIYNTTLCNDAISDFIRENPTQWVWMHERWKTKPEDLK